MRNEQQESIRLTVRNGGWILIVTAIFSAALLVWATWGVIGRKAEHPPGDGRTVESYAFDLTNLTVPKDDLEPVLLHRDFLPRWNDPPHVAGADVDRINEEKRGKMLVALDRVIGVTIGGESRAYPLRIMNVHEVINDTLADVPIAVTYNWQCDSVRVFERRLADETLMLVHSGLFRNSNTIFYNEQLSSSSEVDTPAGGESLIQQLTGEVIAGPLAGASLPIIRADLTDWATWLERRPETTVITENPALHKRYKGADPATYFLTDEIVHDVDALPDDDRLPLKTPCVAITIGDQRSVFALPQLMNNVDGTSARTINGVDVEIMVNPSSKTAIVRPASDDALLDDVTYALWFAQHAFWPDSTLVELSPAARSDAEQSSSEADQ